eukprot:CAMPEP_0194044162 /NCGR_PEP_ID=MMETSP0009_2-20130614/15672_1 /TAXON_ID=210454 /ORGANISM="Grammatophora oceanica, Strain CCMP 410" /LENGTH=268 /DNA_ID=CAMNT_0038688599 /DNA_START=358 /DNA_END=1164 /DNA_ORIENTATION=+
MTSNITGFIARGLSLDGSSGISTPRARQVASQAVLYVLAFYLTYFFSSTNRIYQQVDGQSPFWVKLIHATFQPLQGTFNFFIYRRPVYLRIRRTDPDLSLMRALKRAFHFSPTHKWMQPRAPPQEPVADLYGQQYAATTNNDTNDNNRPPVVHSSLSDRIVSVRESLRGSSMTETEKQLIELEEMEVVGFTTRINTDAEHWLAEHDACHSQDDDRPFSGGDEDESGSVDEEPPVLCRDGTMRRAEQKALESSTTAEEQRLDNAPNESK